MSLSDGNMKVNINNNVTYLTFPVYDNLSFIKHCFSTRLGGVSKGIFESMNLSFNRGDADENVKENYIRISKAIGVNPYKMCIRDRNNKTLTHYIIRKEDEPKEYYYVFYSIDTDKNQITYCVSYSERSTEPVSYTHLDVYKRQILSYVTKCSSAFRTYYLIAHWKHSVFKSFSKS